MKKGTNVGLDRNYKNVCVGDQIKDANGYIYTIDRYGKAVGKGGSAFQLSEIQPFELYNLPPEQLQEDPAPKELDHGPLQGDDPDVFINEATDQMLAAELRRRGYEVKATKTTIVEL